MIDRLRTLDLYGPMLAHVLFPAFEAARGRPTVPLLEYLEESARQPVAALRELQGDLLQRLCSHAFHHTAYYRALFDDHGLRPEQITTVGDLARLPLLERETVRATMVSRRSVGPPAVAITKATSGTSGEPVVVAYDAESRHWRDATRWRGYGWAGYRIGSRAFHYWGFAPSSTSWFERRKLALDRRLKRDHYVDCTPRNEPALAAAVEELVRVRPDIVIAYASGAAALAQYINHHGLRTWSDMPVLVGAERLWPNERTAIERAFGPAFETYGCRELMLIGSECEAHDGLHTSMETMVVELVIRHANGTSRAARPGETGEVVLTDLHNRACPMIRYVNGDLAVAHDDTPCVCGRGLARIGPIEGRSTETLRDGNGAPVGGLVFNILFGVLEHVVSQFQVIQRADNRIVMRAVPVGGTELSAATREAIFAFADKYLAGAPFEIQCVDDIPRTAAGKRTVVIVEPPVLAAVQ